MSDCRTGIPLLRIEDHLQPGSVEWRKVNMAPRSIYERVENCNYACDVAKRQQMKVVGIGGKDIAEGLPKLTLAVVWQACACACTCGFACARACACA